MQAHEQYLNALNQILDLIQKHSLATPKKRPPEPEGDVYFKVKPHGVEFRLWPQTDFDFKRNIIYKLAEEGIIKILQETRSDYGMEGNRFIVKVLPEFDQFYTKAQRGERITRRLETEGYWTQANFQNGEIHFFVGDKQNASGEHAHIILGKTGEIRIDPKDKGPENLVKQVLAITTKDDQTIKASLTIEKHTKS